MVADDLFHTCGLVPGHTNFNELNTYLVRKKTGSKNRSYLRADAADGGGHGPVLLRQDQGVLTCPHHRYAGFDVTVELARALVSLSQELRLATDSRPIPIHALSKMVRLKGGVPVALKAIKLNN